jgi:taurine--2-oxoglutarate transaminase
MSMAKGLTSGYAPLGAVAMRPEISDFFSERVYQGGLTFNSHPISLAAAIANINVLQEDHLVEHAAKTGISLRHQLTELGERHPSVGDVRSIGLFGAIELVRDRISKEPLSQDTSEGPVMVRLRNFFLEQGLFLYTHKHTILIIPPLIITQEQLEDGFRIIDEGLQMVDKVIGNE